MGRKRSCCRQEGIVFPPEQAPASGLENDILGYSHPDTVAVSFLFYFMKCRDETDWLYLTVQSSQTVL